MSDRIAIVGGGLAGLAAAWSLHHADRDFVLYEREPSLGGHSLTVDVDTGDGTVPVDVGNQYVIPLIHPNLFELAGLLGVGFEPLVRSYTVAWGDEVFGTSHRDTALWRRNEAEMVRFTVEMFDLLNKKPYEVISRPIGVYLRGGGYSDEFVRKIVGSVSLIWGVEFEAALDTSMLSYIFSITSGVFSFFAPAGLCRIRGGSRALTDALAAPIADRVRAGCGVTSVVRDADGVTVVDATGRSERFDQIVLALDPGAALAVLDAPTAFERRVFAEMLPYQAMPTVLHTDVAVRIPGIDPALRTHIEVRGNRTLTTDTGVRLADGSPVLVSTGDTSGVDPRKVLAERHFVTDRSSAYGLQVKQHTHRLQGDQRTWYCGSWAILPSSEDALCSGFAVAEALGAPFPLPPKTRVVAVFELVRNLILEGRHDFDLIT